MFLVLRCRFLVVAEDGARLEGMFRRLGVVTYERTV